MIDFFLNAYKDVPTYAMWLEAIAFFFGIASVYFAKKENILVYPVGLIATSITVWLLYKAGYFGDMVVNFYYSIMSIYGWYVWSRKRSGEKSLPVSRTSPKEKLTGIGMFLLTIVVIFAIYKVFGYEIRTENYFDILTSGIFFTAMWYMALKKIESWTLWIIGDIIAIPLYAYRDLGMLSLQYIIFTIVAVQAYIAWRKILNNSRLTS
jgi:nicotinamide mononucleotide transporter